LKELGVNTVSVRTFDNVALSHLRVLAGPGDVFDYNEDCSSEMKMLDGNEIRVLFVNTLVLPWLERPSCPTDRHPVDRLSFRGSHSP
jgi:hypothetical protein